MNLVKYLRHPPSDFEYQGLNLFLRHLQSGNIFKAVWANRISPQASEDLAADVGGDILNSKSNF